jgi:hypothetical protein
LARLWRSARSANTTTTTTTNADKTTTYAAHVAAHVTAYPSARNNLHSIGRSRLVNG